MPIGAFRLNTISASISSGLTSSDFGFMATLTNPNIQTSNTGDNFSRSVSVTDTYVAIGAYLEDQTVANSGVVYIFSSSTGQLVTTILNPNAYSTGNDDRFGYSVALSGNYLIVGAPQEDDVGGTESGKAYIFSTSNWALLYTLNNPNAYSTSATDGFGWSVSISNSYAIVGAYNEDDAGGTDSGKAYIYSTSTGSLVYTLNNPNAYTTSGGDFFGYSVAINDSYAIVGAFGEDDPGGTSGGTSQGKAYVYKFSALTPGTVSSATYVLDNPNLTSGNLYDAFGYSVAINDTYALVGAWMEITVSSTGSGVAYLYKLDSLSSSPVTTPDWTFKNPNLTTSATDYFGKSVALSSQYAIVGSPSYDSSIDPTRSSGKAYIYKLNLLSPLTPEVTSADYELTNPNVFGTDFGDSFGEYVSISDTTAIVSAYLEDEARGSDIGVSYLYSNIDSRKTTPPTTVGIDLIGTITANASTFTLSKGQVGDIAVLCDTSTTTTAVVPAGWTSINSTLLTIRTTVSYKKITAPDVGATFTGLTSGRKVIMIFRDFANSNPTITVSTPQFQGTTNVPTNQTITASQGKSLYFGIGSSTASPSTTMTQSGVVTGSASTSLNTPGIIARYSIHNTGTGQMTASNATITMTDTGSNILQSFRIDIT